MTAIRSMLDPTAAAVLRQLARAERTRPHQLGAGELARVVAGAPVTATAPVRLREDQPTRPAADILLELRGRDRAARDFRGAVAAGRPVPPMIFREAEYVDGLPYRDTNSPWRPWMDRADDDADSDGDADDIDADQ